MVIVKLAMTPPGRATRNQCNTAARSPHRSTMAGRRQAARALAVDCGAMVLKPRRRLVLPRAPRLAPWLAPPLALTACIMASRPTAAQPPALPYTPVLDLAAMDRG